MTLTINPIQITAKQTSIKYSIIIVNHNRLSFVEGCISSIYQHTDTNEIEIILVDNASITGDLEAFVINHPGIRVTQSKENLGFGFGNNLGSQFANGQYLIFLNPDTMVTSGWLEALIQTLDSDPKIGLVTPKILLASAPSRINACGHQVHYSGIVQCRGLGTPKVTFNRTDDVSAVSGAAFVIHASTFREINGFDAPFFLYIEDTDISWRARLAGFRCVYVPDSIIYHDYSLVFWKSKMFFYERNRYTLLLKNYKWGTLLLLIPPLLLVEFIAWVFVLQKNRKNWQEKLSAYRWIINNWQNIMQARKQVQRNRKEKDHILLEHTTYKLAFEQTLGKLPASVAHILLDPIFYLYRTFLLMIVRW
jgi:GT2 family glycosyltransferase